MSNSSSSSFIISDKHFPTIKDLATYMIKQKIEGLDDYMHDENVEYNEKLIERLSDVDESQSISFNSCNYDTYIKKVGDCFLVSTCNNTQWELYGYTTKLTEKSRREIVNLANKSTNKVSKKLLDLLDIDLAFDEFFSFGNDYYNLDKELLGAEVYEYCPNEDIIPHGYNYHMWDTIKHGKICLVCNKVWKRKEKLEKINKS